MPLAGGIVIDSCMDTSMRSLPDLNKEMEEATCGKASWLVSTFALHICRYTYSASVSLDVATNSEGLLNMCPYRTGRGACHVTLPKRSRAQQHSARRANSTERW